MVIQNFDSNIGMSTLINECCVHICMSFGNLCHDFSSADGIWEAEQQSEPLACCL